MVTFNKNDIEWIESISLSQFSNKAIILSGRVARELRKNGREIQLNDPQLSKALVSEVCINNDPKVYEIFTKLKIEFELIAKKNGLLIATNNQINESFIENTDTANDTSNTQLTKKQRMYRGVPID